MKKFNNKGGFTLIEVIVVLIIVGALAAIAFPNLFSNIQKSQSAQVLTQLDVDKTSLEACLADNINTSAGVSPCTIAGQNLVVTANGWTYSIPPAGTPQTSVLAATVASAGTFGVASTLQYSIVATDSGGNTVALNRNTAGIWTCSTGTSSAYAGIC